MNQETNQEATTEQPGKPGAGVEAIIRKAEAREQQEATGMDAKEGELLDKQKEEADQEKMQRAIKKAALAMGVICGGVKKLYPEVQVTQSLEFFEKGTLKAAVVLVKYDDGTPPPPWVQKLMTIWGRWQEEADFAIFLGLTMRQALKEIRLHEEAMQKAEQEAADNGNQSE